MNYDDGDYFLRLHCNWLYFALIIVLTSLFVTFIVQLNHPNEQMEKVYAGHYEDVDKQFSKLKSLWAN